MSEYIDLHLFSLGGADVTLGKVTIAVVVFILTLIVSKVLQRTLTATLRVRGMKDEGAISVTSRLVHYFILMLGLGVALKSIGIDLGTLFTAGALFAVAIGFAMQNLTQNFVSGLILMVERTIKPGDILEVESEIVRVSKMGIRSTVARTLDDDEIIIPNSKLVESPIKNYTLKDSILRLRAKVGVVYSADMRLVRKVLEEVSAAISWQCEGTKPVVRLRNFGDSSVDWEVSVWIENPWSAQQRTSDLYEAVWWALKDAGITIAFPQVDVHFDPQVEHSLRGVGSLGKAG